MGKPGNLEWRGRNLLQKKAKDFVEIFLAVLISILGLTV
jgi:hypothetical protein